LSAGAAPQGGNTFSVSTTCARLGGDCTLRTQAWGSPPLCGFGANLGQRLPQIALNRHE
jgi:hypothetical protein